MAQKVFDFSKRMLNPTTDEEGDELSRFLGLAIANGQASKELSTMKLYVWAKELLKGEGLLVLDPEEVRLLRSFIEGSNFLNLWTKGTLMDVLEGGEPLKLRSSKSKDDTKSNQ